MPDLFPTLFHHPTLWLSDVTLLHDITVFLVSASDTTFLTLRSGIKYCSVCMVTTYLQAAVGCDLNRSAIESAAVIFCASSTHSRYH